MPTAIPKRTTVRKLLGNSPTIALRYIDVALPRLKFLERGK